ncbi:MAG: type II toxin-antitoxin system VapC family toxin [Candidatus Sulfotelmatobacter sp.]
MILLDTHTLLWMASDPKRLSKRAHDAIRDARKVQARQDSGVAIATITLWELAWLAQNGRIVVTGSVESFVRETVARVILRPVSPEITAFAVRLPKGFSRDPADRLITATAMVEGMALVTADTHIRRAKVVDTV